MGQEAILISDGKRKDVETYQEELEGVNRQKKKELREEPVRVRT